MPARLPLVAALSLVLAAPALVHAKGPIKSLTLDPDAEVVELFEASARGDLKVRLIAKSAREANLFVENTTAAPLTVAMPPAIAAVHVLKQFQPLPNQGPFGIAPDPNLLNTGQGQAIGGPVNPLNGPFPQQNALFGNGNNQLGPGLNFFSVPPERSVWLKVDSVCLDHGKPNPKPQMSYVVVPLEKQVDDPVLQQVLTDYDTETESRTALQAAAWHFSNGYSWEEIARLPVRRGNIVRAYFTAGDVKLAKSLAEQARKKIEAREQQSNTTTTVTRAVRVAD